MRIFDLHADIGTDLYEKALQGEKQVLRTHHLTKLEKGDVRGVCTACYFCGTEDWQTMQAMVENCFSEIQANQSTVRQVLGTTDLIEDEKLLALISVEGMCGIQNQAEEKINWLYAHGVRIASLVWNESNALANGWKQDPLRGLSALGIEAVRTMNRLRMTIDVSHINEHGFWDVIALSEKPVIATHSNARGVCNHPRNLTDQQIKAIAQKGGLIGLNAANNFVAKESAQQNAATLAKHARYLAELAGIEHVACGFDFMDYMDGEYSKTSMAYDLTSALEAQNLIQAFQAEGFSQTDIRKIAWENTIRFLKENL